MTKTLKDRAMELSMKAMSKIMADPRRADAIGELFTRAQKGKEALDGARRRILSAAGLATREDFKSAGKRIGALKRQAQALEERLAGLRARVGA